MAITSEAEQQLFAESINNPVAIDLRVDESLHEAFSAVPSSSLSQSS